jgi:predicted lipoprotein with Yx(FWY)xxD motif
VRREPAPPAPGWLRAALLLAGPGLLIASGAIHLDLYLTGYRTIPTIGWLFLLQVITAFGLGLAVLALRSRLAAVAAGVFSLSVLGGYLLSVWIGLFGFKEVRTTAGIVAGVLDVAAFAALAAFALAPAPAHAAKGLAKLIPKGVARALAQLDAAIARVVGMAVAGVAVVALVLLGVAVAGASGSGPAAGAPAAAGGLKTATIGGATVLTNAKGFTLYSFAPDSATKSACYGSCAQYWPPVIGTAAAGRGVPGTFTTIKRTDGTSQLTYNGHPLYTYIGDSAPGQAHGNNLNLNGGLWKEITVSGG